MKHYKSINKIYYDTIMKHNIDNRPIFIWKVEGEYLVYKDIYNIKEKFKKYDMAIDYIYSNYENPFIIEIIF